MKRDDFRAFIEQEIFNGRSYGFARLELPHISQAIVADMENEEVKSPKGYRSAYQESRVKSQKRCIKLCDVNDPAFQKRVENFVDSSAQVFIDLSEIQRRVTPGKKERYFP